MGEYLSRNVSGERRAQYGPRGIRGESIDQRADDLRRVLILKYGIHPSERAQGLSPRNLWQEEVDDLKSRLGPNCGEGLRGVDEGTSSGYLPELLFKSGYRGSLVAFDAEAAHLQRVYNRIKGQAETAEANILLGRGDAERLREVTTLNGEKIEIPDSYFDFCFQNNILHHTPSPEKAIDEAIRITKRGGLLYFMGRGVGHFQNMYEILRLTAEFYNTEKPKPFYNEFDIFKKRDLFENAQGLKIINEVNQAIYIWVPNTEEGWYDYSGGLYTHLPLMKSRSTGLPLQKKDVEEYIEGPIRKAWFERHASYTDNHMTDLILQKFIVCEVTK